MKIFNSIKVKSLLISVLLIAMMAPPTTTMAAQKTVNLGTTSGFAVLAHETITNTGPTTIKGSVDGDVGGDVGLYPGTSFTGQAQVTMSGKAYLADDVSKKAQGDLVTAYNDAAGRTATRIQTELGGQILKPGVYDSASGTFEITGKLTLDAEGDPDAVFIFQTKSTLITASDSSVVFEGKARFCRTFWQVGTSATLGERSDFAGHIFAMESITAVKGASVQGQLLARTGAVTLDINNITNGICESIPELSTLKVIKHVINDDGGTKDAADFNLHIKNLGKDVTASPAPGAESGKTYTLTAGTYVVSEDDFDGYTASYTGGINSTGNITLAPGENKTITITNNDIAVTTPPPVPEKATLHVIKHVINDSGRRKVASDFKLHIKTLGKDVVSPAPGAESPGNTYTLTAGTYVVSEDDFDGYTASYTGGINSTGNITLAPGENKTITITNNDIAVTTPPPVPEKATLHVIKHVINDNGGTAVAADFNLHVKTLGKDIANSPARGTESGTTYTLTAGTYAISEDAFSGYTVSYSGGSNSTGNITLAPGENKTITITNNDIPTSPVKPTVKPPVKPTVTPPIVTSTVTGGQLPKTSTHLYDVLIVGVVLTFVGALGWTRRKRYE